MNVSITPGLQQTVEQGGEKAPSGDAPDDLLAIVQTNLTRAAIRLSHVIDEVEAGRLDHATEAKKATDSLMGFVRLLMEERNKVDKLRKSVASANTGTGALDFAAARDEIGRRLALLRDAGGH